MEQAKPTALAGWEQLSFPKLVSEEAGVDRVLAWDWPAAEKPPSEREGRVLWVKGSNPCISRLSRTCLDGQKSRWKQQKTSVSVP
jgi:hypothetical protein